MGVGAWGSVAKWVGFKKKRRCVGFKKKAAHTAEPSKDLEFYLDLYRVRDDIRAVVHCHSPWATGYASAGFEIPCLTVQTIEKIGRMPLIHLCPNGGPQTAREISPVFSNKEIVAAVLANHGTIGVGPNLMKAQYLAEIIEEIAHIAYVRDTLMAAHRMPTAM